MSEGRSSPTTLEEQRRPDRFHVNLLHEIVLRAQQDPLSGQSPKDALLNAYSAIFEEHNLDVLQDSVCFWTLLKVIDPSAPKGSLYEKFESVLKDEGIELSFDDDASQNGTLLSTTESASPIKYVPRRRRPASQSSRMDFPAPASRTSQSPASKLSHSNLTSHHGNDDVDYDEYMDNPPQQMVEMMRIAEAMDRKTLVRQSLAVLRPRGVAAMEFEADAIYEGRLKNRVVHQWRSVATDQQRDVSLADHYYVRRLKRVYLRKLLDAARIQRIKAMDEERLKGVALYKMTLATREAQFRRKLDMKIKARYFEKLAQSFRYGHNHQHELEAVLQRQQVVSNMRILRPAVLAMLQATRKAIVLDTVAQEYNSSRLKSRMVTRWYDQTRNLVQMQTNASEARRNFLMRKYLDKLRKATREKRERRAVLAKWVLARWRGFVESKKHETYDVGYRRMRKIVKMNLARGLLQKWAERTRQLQEMEARADLMYTEKIKRTAHQAIVSMYERSQQVSEFEKMAEANANKLAMKHALGALTDKSECLIQMDEVAHRFHTLHSQQIAMKCFKQLGMKSFEIRRRERDAEAFRARHDKKLVRSSWERMRMTMAQRRGEGPLRLPPATPAQRRAEEINRLTSTTPLYTPASRLSFAARLRGDGNSIRADQISNQIMEESETSTADDT